MITFKAKPIPVSAEYRPMYRIGQILLVLGRSSTKNEASLLKLHYFSWAMRSPDNMQQAISLAKNKYNDYSFAVVWNVEPSLNRALAYATSERLVEFDNGRYQLTARGKTLLHVIDGDETTYVQEKEFLATVKKKISESKLQRLSRWWETQND